MYSLTRRGLLALAAASAVPAALSASPAGAVSPQEAEKFVAEAIGDVTGLINSGKPAKGQAQGFRTILERRAATPQIARFVMGLTWREMSESQKTAFIDAYLDYISRIYVGLLDKYRGQRIDVAGSRDFGRKGVLVYSVAHGADVDDAKVEWLVSDRGGAGVKLVDLVVEGVSMLQTQRQELAAMLEKRGGDVDRLIADMQAG